MSKSTIPRDTLDKARSALSFARNLQNGDDDTEVKFTLPCGDTIIITVGWDWKDGLRVLWTDRSQHINPRRHRLRELLLEDMND